MDEVSTTHGTGRIEPGRDQLARAAMQLAPEYLFELLACAGDERGGAAMGRAQRLDTQGSLSSWLVDGLYLHEDGQHANLWIVEMQSRARAGDANRAGGVLVEVMGQLRDARQPLAGRLRIFLVEVRTDQAVRTSATSDSDTEDESPLKACQPALAVNFQVSNRLLVDGYWTLGVERSPVAWPLWAFRRGVQADDILERMSMLDQAVRYHGWISALLRWIGRVRFPEDERFMEVPEQEMNAMSGALAQLVDEGRLLPEERKELVSRYLARLELQRRRWREEGREEGRRDELLLLAEAVAPEMVDDLRAIADVDALRSAVRDLLASVSRG